MLRGGAGREHGGSTTSRRDLISREKVSRESCPFAFGAAGFDRARQATQGDSGMRRGKTKRAAEDSAQPFGNRLLWSVSTVAILALTTPLALAQDCDTDQDPVE